MTDGNKKYAVFALLELGVTILFLTIGWYWLALGWAGMFVTELLTYEWSENPDRYGRVGDNPYLYGALLSAIILVYWFGYLAVQLLTLV